MKKIKVLVIDDSAVARQTLSEIINSDPNLEVVATASDPIFAAKKIKTIIPDVITLDIEMPRMDGITFLEKIMSQHPIPVVVISSLTTEGSNIAIRALQLGAVEIITKPKLSTKEFYRESKVRITDAIIAASMASLKKIKSSLEYNYEVKPKNTADVILSIGKHQKTEIETEKIIVIGASTGGTQAISEVLCKLHFNTHGIVIVQHMPETFTTSFAKRLNEICKIKVKEAKNGDSVLKGTALIAPGNKHLLLKRNGSNYFVEVKDGPLVNRHRPSVDVLFRSAARYAGKNAIGIILTGMGNDGAKGMLEMKERGAFTIAQDEESSVVFGMPKEAINSGGVNKVMNLNQIADYIATI
ncbi:MAG: chemotaxis response regulator protein-glutamate methylesterase [Bacteroidales bacterium]|nr:chemotaxis response regulator protein-glutamate methylesterase [Bacteroidales bacterium]